MKTTRIGSLLLILSIIILASCQKSVLQTSENQVDAVKSSDINKSLLLSLVNEVRQNGCNCGGTTMPPVSAITWNDQLGSAALAHASDMSANSYFSHTGLNSSTPGDRITNAGYSWHAYGENIARGYTSEEAVVAAWIASEGHCKNIMSAAVNEMGVARVNNYWVQEFGAKQ